MGELVKAHPSESLDKTRIRLEDALDNLNNKRVAEQGYGNNNALDNNRLEQISAIVARHDEAISSLKADFQHVFAEAKMDTLRISRLALRSPQLTTEARSQALQSLEAKEEKLKLDLDLGAMQERDRFHFMRGLGVGESNIPSAVT